MHWYEKLLRIAALQCASEGDPQRVLRVWDKWGFNTEQLLHLSAYGYAGYKEYPYYLLYCSFILWQRFFKKTSRLHSKKGRWRAS